LNDLEKELLEYLEKKWALKEDLKKKNVSFHRAVKEPEDIVKPDLNVQHSRLSQSPIGAKADSLEGADSELIIIRVKAKSERVKDIHYAKELKWKMMSEVDRILREGSKNGTLPSGWEDAYVSTSDCFDNLAFKPPIMEERLAVRIIYQV